MSWTRFLVVVAVCSMVAFTDAATTTVLYNATMWKSLASIDGFVTNASQILYIPPERIVVVGLNDSPVNDSVALMSFYFVDADVGVVLDRGDLGVPSSSLYENPNGYDAATLDYILQNMDRSDTEYLLSIIDLRHNGSAAVEPSSWAPAVWPPASTSVTLFMCVQPTQSGAVAAFKVNFGKAVLGLNSSVAEESLVVVVSSINNCPMFWTNVSVAIPGYLQDAVAAAGSLSFYSSDNTTRSSSIDATLSFLLQVNVSHVRVNTAGGNNDDASSCYSNTQREKLSPLITTISFANSAAPVVPSVFAAGLAQSLNLSSPSQIAILYDSTTTTTTTTTTANHVFSFTIFSVSAYEATLAIAEAFAMQKDGDGSMSSGGGSDSSAIGGFSTSMIISGSVMFVIVLVGIIVVIWYWKHGSIQSKASIVEDDYLVPLKQR